MAIMRLSLSVVCAALVVGLFVGCSSAADAVDFNYRNQTAWNYLTNSQCGNNRQSPIDIVVSETVPADAAFTRLRLIGWDTPVRGNLSNMFGVVLGFVPEARTARTFTHLGEYEVIQFHFHWSNRTGEGSEHLLDGNQYDGELHFVHSKYSPKANKTDGDALTVVGVLLQSNETAPVRGTIWENFVVNPLPGVNHNIPVSGITYSAMLPQNRTYFYYEGSLTTPLCNEIVQWIVLANPIQVPAEVLRNMRTMWADVNETIARTVNYRNPQPRNSRQVLRFSSATVNTPFCFAMIAVIAAIALHFINP